MFYVFFLFVCCGYCYNGKLTMFKQVSSLNKVIIIIRIRRKHKQYCKGKKRKKKKKIDNHRTK